MAAPTQFSPQSYSVYGTWLIVTEVMFYAQLALRSPDGTLNHTSIQMSKASYASHPEPIYVTKMLGQTPAKQAMYSLHRQNVTEGGTSFESCLQ